MISQTLQEQQKNYKQQPRAGWFLTGYHTVEALKG